MAMNFSAACLTLASLSLAVAGTESYYTVRPDDGKAVYLTREAFSVRGDGVADDTAGLQAAIDRV